MNGTNALQQGLAQSPQVVTLWIGNNDVLGALLYGIALDGVTLTTVSSFTESYTQIIQAIASEAPEHARDPQHPSGRRRPFREHDSSRRRGSFDRPEL